MKRQKSRVKEFKMLVMIEQNEMANSLLEEENNTEKYKQHNFAGDMLVNCEGIK